MLAKNRLLTAKVLYRFRVVFLAALLGFSSLLYQLGSCGASTSQLQIPASGLRFDLAGKRNAFGSYTGYLDLRARSDGRIDVQRIVDYSSFRFEGKRVQEVWTGIAEKLDGNKLNLEFKLKRANVFSEVDGVKRDKSQFEMPLRVKYSVELEHGSEVHLRSPDDASEVLSRSVVPPSNPWQDLRKNVLSRGDCFQIIGKWARLSLFMPATIKLQFDPLMKPYLSRSEFVSENQFFISDQTDFEFLRKNPDLIRVPNKVLDLISLLEGFSRNDAYSLTLSQKAEVFENEMLGHLNQLGLYAGTVYDTKSQRALGFLPNGDGALWSGMYAGAEAMRYLATHDAEALSRYKRVTRGLMLLMDLTGNPREFGRTAELMVPSEVLSGPWRQGVVPFQNIKYVEGGNNDMVKGLFHAFAWAYEILPEDDPFLIEVSKHSCRLPQLKVAAREKVHPGNAFTAQGLSALGSGNEEDLNTYLRLNSFVMQPIDSLNLNKGFYFGGVADWSGVNLGMVAQLSDILVAKNLLKRAGLKRLKEEEELKKLLVALRQKLVNTWAIYEPAHRDFITVAADAFAVTDPKVLAFPKETQARNWSRKEKWIEARVASVWSLREIPGRKLGHQVSFDYTLKPEWCASAWALRPWKIFVEENKIDYHLQGAYNYPYFEGPAFGTDNFWTNGFEFRGMEFPDHRNGRCDYLHVYWMGRLSGLINNET